MSESFGSRTNIANLLARHVGKSWGKVRKIHKIVRFPRYATVEKPYKMLFFSIVLMRERKATIVASKGMFEALFI